MNPQFCLNAATIKGTPLRLQLQLASDAGFKQIGLWLSDVDQSIAEGSSLNDIKAQLDSCGLRVAEFCYLGGWQDAEEARFKEVLNQAHRLSSVARALGCDILVAVPALSAGSLVGAPERLREVCQVAAAYGVRVALEFPGIAAEVRDLRTARNLLSAAGCANAGLVLDTFHFFLGGSSLADMEGMAEILLVHASDAMNLPIEELRRPHDNRTFPGEGIIDLAPIFERLDQMHYGGPISLEIWNRKLHQSNPAEVVKRSCESLRYIERVISKNHAGIR
jgi:2-keto-myo-inositol isomerase